MRHWCQCSPTIESGSSSNDIPNEAICQYPTSSVDANDPGVEYGPEFKQLGQVAKEAKFKLQSESHLFNISRTYQFLTTIRRVLQCSRKYSDYSLRLLMENCLFQVVFFNSYRGQ